MNLCPTMRVRAVCASTLWMVAACGGPASTTTIASPDASNIEGNARSERGEDMAVPPSEMCEAATWGEPDSLYQQWVSAPSTHPNVPDISYAGYRGGAPIPSEAGRVRVHVTDYGAVANSTDDASDAVAAAIAAVSATGGVVVFPEGTLHLRRPIAVQHNGVVLRGAGKGRTRLVFEQSLDDGYAQNQRGDGDSLWSWLGGLIWFSPSGLRDFPARTETLGDGWREGWAEHGRPAPILAEATRGQGQLTLGADHGFVVGQRVLVVVNSSEDFLKHLAGDGAFSDAQAWSLESAGWLLPPSRTTIAWPAMLARVDAETVELRQPLRFDLRAEWSPRLVGMGPVIEECGVVGMSVVMQRQTPWTRALHHHEVGWNGVYFENAWNCYADDLDVQDAENAILITASKHITVRNFTIDSSTEALSAQHHGTVTRMASNDVLFEDFTISAQPWHGISVETFSMGNVWSRGTLEHGTWDLHRGLPIDNAITELTIHNDGRAGGRSDAGPRTGAHNTIWNVALSNQTCSATLANAAIFPNGVIVGLRGCDPGDGSVSECVVRGSGIPGNVPTPENLYEAQHAVRMCREGR